MPTLIDQRILIPASTPAVWSVLADQSHLPRWRVDCDSAQVITTRQFGVGMQRQVTYRGNISVEAMTAWYEGLGYEYQVVDAKRFKFWVGRLRLQSVPDGTIVQWTIQYQPKGLLGRLFNSISGAARREEDCANSLRGLRRFTESLGYGLDAEGRKRQTLQPVASIVKSSTQPIVAIDPDGVADDTKPRRPDGLDEAIAASSTDEKAPPTVTNMQTPAEAPQAVVIPKVDEPPSDSKPDDDKLPPGMPESIKATPPKGTPRVDLSRLRYADELDQVDNLLAATPPNDDTPTQELPPPTQSGDTGQISIWEAFGLKAPSQLDSQALDEVVKRSTGQHQTVNVNDEPSLREGDTFTFSPLYKAFALQVRVLDIPDGLRLAQARQQAPVRSFKDDKNQ